MPLQELALNARIARAERIGAGMRPNDLRGGTVIQQHLEASAVGGEPRGRCGIKDRARRLRHIGRHHIEMNVNRPLALCGNIGEHEQQRMIGRHGLVRMACPIGNSDR